METVSGLRDYQAEAIRSVFSVWREHVPGASLNALGGDLSAVCLVSPTGSGKTRMGSEVVTRAVKAGKRVLWIAHRTELIQQAAATLQHAIGQPVATTDAPLAKCIVMSIQTMLASDTFPACDLLVIDECHHIVADQWSEVLAHYKSARVLGLSATPTRLDEKPLGVVFGSMVPATNYGELLRDGYLVDAIVHAPNRRLEKGIALEPLAAYEKHTKGKPGFVFVRTKAEAEEQARQFTEAGYPAAAITDSTPKGKRKELIAQFRAGELTMLCNVYTLTEGFDAPHAEVAILARNCGHISMYLQIVGRVLRPSEGKQIAHVIDLVGSMREHGFPTEDRHWDLMVGKVEKGEAARYGVECPECFAYFMRSRVCPDCGYEFPVGGQGAGEDDDQIVYNVELQTITSASQARRTAATDEEKAEEFRRLVKLCKDNEWSLSWAAKKYREKFDEEPPKQLDMFDEIQELKALVANAEESGAHAYFVVKRFKETFGKAPNFSLVDCEKLKDVTLQRMREKSGGKLTRKDRAVFLQMFGR